MAKRKMGESKAKVFCGECKYLIDADDMSVFAKAHPDWTRHWCGYEPSMDDDYLQRNHLAHKCQYRNAKNDCPDFEAVPEEPKAEPKGRLQRVREWLMG